MHAGQLMVADVASCSPKDTLQEAARRLASKDLGVLPVVDDAGRLVGILTDRDICLALAGDRPLAEVDVAATMSRPVHACHANDDLSRVERSMRERRVRRLPVVHADGRLAGIVSIDDLARHVIQHGSVFDARSLLETLASTTHFAPFDPHSAKPRGITP